MCNVWIRLNHLYAQQNHVTYKVRGWFAVIRRWLWRVQGATVRVRACVCASMHRDIERFIKGEQMGYVKKIDIPMYLYKWDINLNFIWNSETQLVML